MTKNIHNSITFTCKCKYNKKSYAPYLLKAFEDTKIAIEACGFGRLTKQAKQINILP